MGLHSTTDKKSPEVFVEENSKYHPAPDNPADYNIQFQGQFETPLTEQQWEYRMREGLAGAQGSEQSPEQLLGGIEKNPTEIADRISEINSQIKEYEATTLNNPADRKAQERLQILYMLKATLTVLKDKVAPNNP